MSLVTRIPRAAARSRINFSLLASALIPLFAGGIAQAASTAVFVAVPTGSAPGLWRFTDTNGDGDALDSGEAVKFATGPKVGFTDVAVDYDGVIYAIEDKSGKVFRIQDNDGDGTAFDAGEVKVFRDVTGSGVKLEGNLSVTTSAWWDAESGKVRTAVYVMDLSHGTTYRLIDRDGDGDAQSSNEISLVQKATGTAPFTPSRMMTDDLGRIYATVSNQGTLARLDDVNADGSAEDPGKSGSNRCSAPSCGPVPFAEYRAIPVTVDGKPPFKSPFGISLDATGVIYASDTATPIVVRVRDTNRDEDGLDAGESNYFYSPAYAAAPPRFYDVLVDEKRLLLGTQASTNPGVLTALQDLNADGDANDSGEAKVFANVTGGTPVGLAARPTVPPRPLGLEAIGGVDLEGAKGTVVVLEPGTTTTVKLQVIDPATGKPVSKARVGAQVAAGCLSVCPLNGDMTDSYGNIAFTVKRLSGTTNGEQTGETLKFWVFGQELFLDVVDSACTPYPVAVPGKDQTVASGTTVTLDGSASKGNSLAYCWTQIDGPIAVTLTGTCGSTNPVATFKAPTKTGTYHFLLTVANGCEVVGEATMGVTVKSTLRTAP